MAWWVVCQHLLQISGMQIIHDNPAVKLLTMGGLAVVVFIVISGFVITNLLITKREAFAPYLARRFFRIYPLYLIAILAALVLQGQYVANVALAPWMLEAEGARALSDPADMPWHIALHAVLMHGMVPNSWLSGASSSILAPAWSLSLEWQYYIVAPLLTACLVWKRWTLHIAAVAVCAVFLVWVFSVSTGANWNYPSFLPILIGFFLIGAVTRLWLHGIGWKRLALPGLLGAANVIPYAQVYTGGHLAVAAIPLTIWAITIFGFAYTGRNGLGIVVSRLVRWALGSKAVVNLGTWSYSTYLLHVPLFVVALTLLKSSGVAVNSYSYFFAMLAACIVLVPLSWLAYRFIEKPAMKVGARWINGVWKTQAAKPASAS